MWMIHAVPVKVRTFRRL